MTTDIVPRERQSEPSADLAKYLDDTTARQRDSRVLVRSSIPTDPR
ncbi:MULTISPECIES: hypothetical protein [Mycetohabitans]|nr:MULTISPECIES: hypothetical protein [Mycetohabitans]